MSKWSATRSPGPRPCLVADLPFAVLFVALIVLIAAPIVWVLALILPTFVLLAWRAARVLSERSSAERKVGYGRDALVQEMVTGRTTVKALALEDSIRPIWEDRHADTIEQALDRGGSADKYVNFGAGLNVEPGVIDRRRGACDHQPGHDGRLAHCSPTCWSAACSGRSTQLVGSWRNYAQFQQAVNRLGEVFRMPEERQEMAIDMGRPKGELTVDHASFSL